MMRFAFRKVTLAALFGAIALAGLAQTQVSEAQDLKKVEQYRLAVMMALSWHASAVAAMVKGSAPFDTAALTHHADALKALSLMVAEGYPEGSQGGDHSEAKPDIWSDPEGFAKRVVALETSTAALAAAAPTMTAEQLPDALNAVGQACSSCHRSFRE